MRPFGVTTQAPTCANCGADIPADAPLRQCPRCLLDLGLSCKTDAQPEPVFAETIVFPGSDPEFDYELLERIGRGGMGIVYRARQRSLNRTVALKMIAVGEFASPAVLARFRHEAETAAKLDHANIVSIIEIGQHRSSPFLVMRLVEGASLASRLHEVALPRHPKAGGAGRAQIRIARLLATVARAVDYAHRRGVLHRDLKPSNILLDLDGNPHLTDFGIAKSLDEETSLTETADLLGTLSYMAPEQAAGKTISPAADVYSLGAILYELLTGHPPFEGAKMDLLRQLLQNDPLPPQLINHAIDRDLATICLKCLDKEPARRYRSALELAHDLDRWRRHEPILARQAGPVIRLRRWTVRNPAVATLLLSLTIGIAIVLALLARANEEKARKSVALDILRTESARQLQEMWSSGNSYFAIKSETLSAMAGMEVATLTEGEHRFTIALVADGNPLDRVMRVAPLIDQLERSMSAAGERPTRFDLRVYKNHPGAVGDLVKREIDFAQLNPLEFLRARELDPEIQPLVTILPAPGLNNTAVIFTRKNTGIKTLADLPGKSFLLGTADSTLSFWTKVQLLQAGIRASDFSKYRYTDRVNDLSKDNASAPAVIIGNPFSSMTPVEAVIAGVYDAAVVREKRFREVAVEQQLVPLDRFEDTGDLFVARGQISPDTARVFLNGIVGLTQSSSEQSFLDAPVRFRAAAEDDFKEMSSKLESEVAFEK